MSPYDKIIMVLKSHQIGYQEIDHPPVYTSYDTVKIPGLYLNEAAKSLLLKTKDKFVLVVMAGNKRLDSKKLKRLLGVKTIRFATPAEAQAQMDCLIGACYPFGSIKQLETYIDRSLLSRTHLSLNPGVHHKSLRIKLTDYIKVEQPVEVSVTID